MAIHSLQNPPQSSAQPAYSLSGIPDGPDGTRQTLAIMRRIVKRYRTDPGIISLAHDIVREVPGKAYSAEAAAIQTWVRNNIRYTQDVYDVETLYTPDVLLVNRMGDCDDQSVLVATLLNAIGHEARFIAVSFAPDVFSHVLTETKIGDRWHPLETTESCSFGQYPWVPGEVLSKMIEHI